MKSTLKRRHKIEPSSQAAPAKLTQREEMYQESKPCSEHSLYRFSFGRHSFLPFKHQEDRLLVFKFHFHVAEWTWGDSRSS